MTLANGIRYLLPRITVFGALYCLVVLIVIPPLNVLFHGEDTYTQIERDFVQAIDKNYEVVILGNSHFSYGVDPTIFSRPTYNFGFVNDAPNQYFYKLRYLVENGVRPKSVIIGLDYFQLNQLYDSRNYAYVGFFDEAYLSDYPEKNYKLRHWLDRFNPFTLNSYQHGVRTALLNNGQQTTDDVNAESNVKNRKIEPNKIQEAYFKRCLALCESEGIQALVVMPPIQQEELSSYDVKRLRAFESFVEEAVDGHANATFHNFTNLNFPATYYRDFTHLNEQGAKEFSMLLNEMIEQNPIGTPYEL